MTLAKKLGAIAIVGISFLPAACAPTYETKLEDKLIKRGFTKQQAEVGIVMGERMLFMNEKKQVREEDGAITYSYEFNNGGVTIEDTLGRLNRIVSDLEQETSHKNRPEEEKFIDQFGIREESEKKLLLFTYLRDQLTLKQLNNTFQDLMGTRKPWPNKDQHNVRPDETYTLGAFLPTNGNNKLEFDAKYVQEARSTGKLKDKKYTVEQLTHIITFKDKIPNPDYPYKDPNTQFIDKERQQGILIISYNLDGNTENIPTYVEAYRLKPDGTSESQPALKIFKPIYGHGLKVLVLDKDKETDKRGFGKPDSVQEIWEIQKGSDIISRQEIWDYIFTKEDIPPIPKLNLADKTIHVVEAGKDYYLEYEIKTEGWESDLPEYNSAKLLNNFMLHVQFEKLSENETNENLGHHGTNKKPRKIEWIAKEYLTPERIVEFYKPAKPLQEAKILMVRNTSKTELEITEPGKPIQKYSLDTVLEETPYRIDFDLYVSEKRLTILDMDNDRKHYEAKREIRRPDDLKLPQLPR